MSAVKERLIGAITVMDEKTAARLWEIVQGISDETWDRIEEEEPDGYDLQMIRDAEADPDCKVFSEAV